VSPSAVLDGLDNGAQQPLAVGDGGRRRAPQRRDVLGQGADRRQLGGREPHRALPLVPLVLLAQVRPLGERGFPFALELAGHQAVFRLGQLVLAPGPDRDGEGPLPRAQLRCIFRVSPLGGGKPPLNR